MIEHSHEKKVDDSNQHESFQILLHFLDILLQNKMNLVLVKKNHGIKILMEYMKLNNANVKLEI